MIVNEQTRGEAAGIMDDLMAEARVKYGVALVWPQEQVDELIRAAASGYLRRVLSAYYRVDSSTLRATILRDWLELA